MKMKYLNVILFALVLISIGCKNDQSAAKSSSEQTTAKKGIDVPCTYSYNADSTVVGWTAYKFNEKAPVGGKFAKFNVKTKVGTTPAEVLSNLEFVLDVSSVMTKDTSRDRKIEQYFFGTLTDMKNITGVIKSVQGNKAIAEINMNNITRDVELTYDIKNNELITLKGSIDVADWSGMPAINALNKICKDLHKGKDGVSKLWSEVGLNITSRLNKKCQ